MTTVWDSSIHDTTGAQTVLSQDKYKGLKELFQEMQQPNKGTAAAEAGVELQQTLTEGTSLFNPMNDNVAIPLSRALEDANVRKGVIALSDHHPELLKDAISKIHDNPQNISAILKDEQNNAAVLEAQQPSTTVPTTQTPKHQEHPTQEASTHSKPPEHHGAPGKPAQSEEAIADSAHEHLTKAAQFKVIAAHNPSLSGDLDKRAENEVNTAADLLKGHPQAKKDLEERLDREGVKGDIQTAIIAGGNDPNVITLSQHASQADMYEVAKTMEAGKLKAWQEGDKDKVDAYGKQADQAMKYAGEPVHGNPQLTREEMALYMPPNGIPEGTPGKASEVIAGMASGRYGVKGDVEALSAKYPDAAQEAKENTRTAMNHSQPSEHSTAQHDRPSTGVAHNAPVGAVSQPSPDSTRDGVTTDATNRAAGPEGLEELKKMAERGDPGFHRGNNGGLDFNQMMDAAKAMVAPAMAAVEGLTVSSVAGGKSGAPHADEIKDALSSMGNMVEHFKHALDLPTGTLPGMQNTNGQAMQQAQAQGVGGRDT